MRINLKNNPDQQNNMQTFTTFLPHYYLFPYVHTYVQVCNLSNRGNSYNRLSVCVCVSSSPGDSGIAEGGGERGQ